MTLKAQLSTLNCPRMNIHYAPINPPGWRGTLQELRLPLDSLRWAPHWLALKRRPSAAKRTLMLLPGFGATPRSMQLMASYLRHQGHDVNDWGQGRNSGQVPELLASITLHLKDLARRTAQPLTLVGWSLGGYLARELARDEPSLVRQVITLGSPVIGGPSFTAVAPWYRATGHNLAEMEREVAQRFDTPIQAPITALYSKRDGIVAWQACIDHWSPNVKHIEIAETHLGMGFSPQVLATVAAELRRDLAP